MRFGTTFYTDDLLIQAPGRVSAPGPLFSGYPPIQSLAIATISIAAVRTTIQVRYLPSLTSLTSCRHWLTVSPTISGNG
jgi:hypothetical protein